MIWRGLRRIMFKKTIKWMGIIAMALIILIFLAMVVAHSIVFSRADYNEYNSNINLTYEDLDSTRYPRQQIHFMSGKNELSAFLYQSENSKGLIVVAPGHRDPNDVKLYEIRYFVDTGYSVVCLDYTGCFTSSGKNMVGYSQSVYDLDALLTYIEQDSSWREQPLFLFGHSMGGYAVSAVLQFDHNIEKVVSASGFDTPEEQWQYSVKRYTGFFFPIIKPFNSLFINMKYGDDKNLSAVDGINSVTIPVLVISGTDDVFYGGKCPIYDRQDEITNQNCTFMLMEKENHNGHYDYFLTDAALEYQEQNPTTSVNKELYREHDSEVMRIIIEFLE